MFPVEFKKPHYKESYIVDIVDDISSLYERSYSIRESVLRAFTFLFVFLTVRMR